TAVRMRESFFQQVTPDATVLEIGSRARSGISRRDRFPAGSKYVGLDIASGPNVDIVGDAHDLSTFIHEPVDFVLSMSTFEHLLMPWKVAIEMSTVMRVGAIAYIESHQAWPLHEEPWDFWRFSANAWQGLFNTHTGFEIVESGYQFPASITTLVDAGPPSHGLETQPAWLISACLARKIADPLVTWN